MHAFMATVLLRMAGLDSLNGNAEPQPPNGESAQVEQTIGRGERHAVVGTNGLGQAAFLKQALKSGKSSLFFETRLCLWAHARFGPVSTLGERDVLVMRRLLCRGIRGCKDGFCDLASCD